MKTVGILAFQGGVAEHELMIKKCGHRSLEVRGKIDLDLCDALIIPGGESTVIGFFLEQTGLNKEIIQRAHDGMPIWGTCAGAILLARKIEPKNAPKNLDLLDISVNRNAYGTQIDSFHLNLKVPAIGINELKTAFIRAPRIIKTGPKVKILAKEENNPVLVQQGNILASTFHPELRGDHRLHRYFLSLL